MSNVRREMPYSLELDHFLSTHELQQLQARHQPALLELNERYTPNIDPVRDFPVTPLYVDYLRTSWRLDNLKNRSSEEVLLSGLGFAFGLLLARCTELRWALAIDGGGEFITMARVASDPRLVSVPPFNYVAKRQEVENAEVFLHFFEQTNASDIGFHKPKNWLLDGSA
jgi:hypothetical protein